MHKMSYLEPNDSLFFLHSCQNLQLYNFLNHCLKKKRFVSTCSSSEVSKEFLRCNWIYSWWQWWEVLLNKEKLPAEPGTRRSAMCIHHLMTGQETNTNKHIFNFSLTQMYLNSKLSLFGLCLFLMSSAQGSLKRLYTVYLGISAKQSSEVMKHSVLKMWWKFYIQKLSASEYKSISFVSYIFGDLPCPKWSSIYTCIKEYHVLFIYNFCPPLQSKEEELEIPSVRPSVCPCMLWV